jgi:hypothetical protein
METNLPKTPEPCEGLAQTHWEDQKFKHVPGRKWHKAPQNVTPKREKMKSCKKLMFEDPESPIYTYVDGWDFIKIEIADCECATRVEVCDNATMCVCDSEEVKKSPSNLKCGCRVKKCKPLQAAQELI